MRLARLLPVPVAAFAALVALAVPSSASYVNGVVTDSFGTIAIVDQPSIDAKLSGNCTYTRHAVGFESGGGVTFTVVAAGSAGATYRGIEVMATGVVCQLVKPDRVIAAGPEWYPGPASAATASASTFDARVTAVCIEVFAVLRHTPQGQSTNVVSTGRHCR